VAEVDGRIVGHVPFARGWLDAPPRVVEETAPTIVTT
jgi:hypothetical protein